MNEKPARIPEKRVQAEIVKLLESAGAAVYVLGNTRRKGDYPGTMQTPGIADVLAFVPRKRDASAAPLMGWTQVWIEVKAAGGRISDAQRRFATLCAESGQAYLCGGLDTAIEFLRDARLIR